VSSTALFGEEAKHLLGELGRGASKAEESMNIGRLVGGRGWGSAEADIKGESEGSANGGNAANDVSAINRAAVPGISSCVRSDSPFGGILSMDMRWNKLVFEIVFFESFFEFSRGFIVDDIDFWLIVAFCETFVNRGPASFDFGSSFVFEWAMKDAVAVVIVND
jgi:hypothetical protein